MTAQHLSPTGSKEKRVAGFVVGAYVKSKQSMYQVISLFRIAVVSPFVDMRS